MSHSNATAIEEAEARLCELDPQLAPLIVRQRPLARIRGGNYFEALCRAIISQQVSVAAAATIFGRFEAASGLAPERVAALNEEQVKEIGLSRQKTSYLRDLAGHFLEQPDRYNYLERSSDEEVVAELTRIKGVGVWTAHMFLMFTLGRLDVFASDDLGLQRAMQRLYGWSEVPAKRVLEEKAEQWRPFRTVACWHLWESLKA